MSIHIFNENDLINYTAHSAPASGDIRDLTIYRTATRRQRLKTKSKLKRNE